MVLKLKKFLFASVAFVFVATAGIGLSACGDEPENTNLDAQDFYAMSAISSVNYLQGLSSASQSSQSLFADTTTANTRPSSISQTDVDNIVSYMGMFQDMLSSDTTSYYTNGAVSQDDVDYQDYHFKMTLTVPKINGGQEQFVMYYNEVNTETKEEIDDNEIELEINTTLEGVIVNGDEIYDVTGQREYEKEGNDTEVSFEFTTRSRVNTQNYVKIENEKENNEMEYKYSIYNNGNLINETEVEFENERNEKSLELEFVNNSNESQNKVKYEITQSRTNENVFEVSVKNATNNNEIRERFSISITNGRYEFTYANGYTEII